MNGENNFSLAFNLELKSLGEQNGEENETSSFYEHFIPYSVPTLIENDLLSAPEEFLLSKYSGERNDGAELNILIPKGDENRTDWINNNGEYEETCLFDYIADFVFVTELAKSSEKGNRSDDDTKNVRLGILTELLKLKFFQFKIEFSILYNILCDKWLFENISEDINSYAEILYEIVQRNLSDSNTEKAGLTRENIARKLKNNPNELLSFICNQSYNDIQNELLKIYIDTVDEKLLSSLLSVMPMNMPKKYISEDKGCFCIVKNGEKYYFALSGTSWTEQAKLAQFTGKIAKTLNNSLSIKCEFCPVSVNMKAYGIKTELGFKRFHFPRKVHDFFSDMYSFPYCYELQTLFACCERKIFVNTQNLLPIKIHCRWAPCERCQTAVFEELQRHDSLEFIALAKDFPTFKKYVEAGKTKELKLWRLTRE